MKTLHQALIVVTAAVMVFAFRSDLTKEYRASLDELAAFKQVSFGGWSNYVARRYANETDQGSQYVLGLMHQAGVPINGNPNFAIPAFAEQIPPPQSSRLLDFDTFFAKPHRIGVRLHRILGRAKLQQRSQRFLRFAQAPGQHRRVGTDVGATMRCTSNSEIFLQWLCDRNFHAYKYIHTRNSQWPVCHKC
jgi:hypothetical protein